MLRLQNDKGKANSRSHHVVAQCNHAHITTDKGQIEDVGVVPFENEAQKAKNRSKQVQP